MTEGSRCRCPGCGAYFHSPMALDRHRVYNAGVEEVWARVCLSELAMEAIGMEFRTTGEGERLWAVPPGGLEGP